MRAEPRMHPLTLRFPADWERLGASGPARRDRNRAGWDAVLPHFTAACAA